MAEAFTPQEQQLIQRLQNAPQPTLNPARFEAIRAQVLQAMDAPPAPAPRTGITLSTPAIAAVVVVIIIIVIVVVSGILSPPPAPIVPPATTAAPTSTPPPSDTPTAALEATSEVTPEITPEATLDATPEITPEATQDAVIVIEGPIESIDGNFITIFGVTVELDPSDPLLPVIQVGDLIHIEGNTGNGNIIIAVTVTYVNVDVTVNPTSGEVWRDNGSCAHPPPDWAPANGWRRRCQGQTQNNGNGNGNDNGMGMGDD